MAKKTRRQTRLLVEKGASQRDSMKNMPHLKKDADPQELFLLAVNHHQRGQLAEAIALYDRIIALKPDFAEAYGNRGSALYQLGRYEETLASYNHAIALKPDVAEVYNNRGNVLDRLGRYEEALASYDGAIAHKPDYVKAHNNRGNVLCQMGRHEEALASVDRAIALKPDYVDAYNYRGNVLCEMGRYEEALVSYDHAIALKPDVAEVYNNRGNVLDRLSRYEEALASYDHAIALKSDYVKAHNNRGNVLCQLGRHEEALASVDRAIALKPDYVDAYNYRGNVLCEMGRYEEALSSYDHAITLKPNVAEAYNNRGNVLYQMGSYEEALASVDRAIAFKPDYIQAHNNRGNVLYQLGRYEEALVCVDRAIAFKPDYAEAYNIHGNLLCRMGRSQEAEAFYRKAIELEPNHAHVLKNLGIMLEQTGRAAEAAPLFETIENWGRLAGNLRMWAAWSNLAKVDAAFIDGLQCGRERAVPPWPLLNIPALTPQLQRQAALDFANDEYGWALRQPPLVSSVTQNGPLRIGYLSADYYDHATMHLLAGVLEVHDPDKFEVYILSTRPNKTSDSYTQRIAAMPAVFHDLSSTSDAEAAQRIAEIAPHLLIDLKGYTVDTRLGITTRRPAPVIVSWLGYPGTLGHERLADYIIGDPVVTPPAHAGDFSETLALMPHSYQPNDQWHPLDPAPSRAVAGLPETGLVFCSFNQYVKINPDTFDLWCRLLAAIPGSVLWLLAGQEQGMANLKHEAEKRGITGERLIFAQRKHRAEHLARLQLADLSLDTFPCNSHTTASDVLRAGVPLVTRIGETFASRVAASLLTTHGFPELVTTDDQSYFDLALSLARNPVKLADLRQRLQDARQTSLLFDSKRFARGLERLYAAIWAHHLAGNDRTPIILPPE